MPISCYFRDSAAGHESDSCKRRYNKIVHTFTFHSMSRLPEPAVKRVAEYRAIQSVQEDIPMAVHSPIQ